jgi:hypothetical protein
VLACTNFHRQKHEPVDEGGRDSQAAEAARGTIRGAAQQVGAAPAPAAEGSAGRDRELSTSTKLSSAFWLGLILGQAVVVHSHQCETFLVVAPSAFGCFIDCKQRKAEASSAASAVLQKGSILSEVNDKWRR